MGTQEGSVRGARGHPTILGRGEGAHRRVEEEEQRAPTKFPQHGRRATGERLTVAALFLFVAVVACLPQVSRAINCYHGQMTITDGGRLQEDKAFWNKWTGDKDAGRPENCTIAMTKMHDQCSVFCKTYESLTSGLRMYECRRFCMTTQQCSLSLKYESELCDTEVNRPKGNRKLIGCMLKCSYGDNSNAVASCQQGQAGCFTIGVTSDAHRGSVTQLALVAWVALVTTRALSIAS